MDAHYYEIGLHPGRYTEDFGLHIKYVSPGDDADVYVNHPNVEFDFESLRAAELDDAKYGKLLSESIFSSQKARDSYVAARRLAENDGLALRIRISLGAGTHRLNTIRWETMIDPVDNTQMATNQNLRFSRLINDADWRQVKLRTRSKMNALVVVSSPTDIARYGLAAVDSKEEMERVSDALELVNVTQLGVKEFATPRAIFAELRNGYDILYLVCHGAFRDGRPRLWLQNDDGTANIVSGSDVVEQCKELRTLPRLAILASCESAPSPGESTEGAPAHLAPRLAEAGIPAVIGMQGPVSISSTALFMQEFFASLVQCGLVDEAVSTARQSIRDQIDWWVPALVMRLQTGRIWYEPGFTAGKSSGSPKPESDVWEALVNNIRNRECTPIIGPDLVANLLGSRHDLANKWASTYRFPMAARDRENLPQVAQFLSVQYQRRFPRDELLRYAFKETVRQYRPFIDANVQEEDMDDEPADEVAEALQNLFSEQGRRLREQDEAEAHNVLARLPVKTFVTTNYGNMLEDALREAGRDPVVELCRWNPYTSGLTPLQEREPRYRPSFDRPMVFKIFGELSKPQSIVLTEDDYFDFLIGASQNKSLIPRSVRGALCETALVFLGYELDDWDFRVLFRTIIGQEGWGRNVDVRHVAATLDPEEGRIIEPERARGYLERYFTNAKIDIFWGGSDEFLRTLHQKMPRK